ncbi:hypothetical protein PI124_g9417 [Phytophthora idaei]|nr:hypothetical protein PI124_g9417 [Phytophthora idaei]
MLPLYVTYRTTLGGEISTFLITPMYHFFCDQTPCESRYSAWRSRILWMPLSGRATACEDSCTDLGNGYSGAGVGSAAGVGAGAGVGKKEGVGASTVTEELPVMERLALGRAANGCNAGTGGAAGFCGNAGV